MIPDVDRVVTTMTSDEAYAALAEELQRNADGHLWKLWRALDELLRNGGNLPQAWARLTATPAATRAGKSAGRWMDMVNKGYAPAPDGTDDAGRSWWYPSTVDAFVSGEWQPTPRQRDPQDPPPMAGPGSSAPAWREYARRHGVPITDDRGRPAGRVLLQQRCREAGLIP